MGKTMRLVPNRLQSPGSSFAHADRRINTVEDLEIRGNNQYDTMHNLNMRHIHTPHFLRETCF